MRRLSIASVVATSVILSGCIAAELATGRPGTDLMPVHKGASKQDIEDITGEPQRCWTNDAGVAYCLYEIDAGRGSQPMMALGWLAADIVTLGILEFAGQGIDTQEEKDAFYGGAESSNFIVSYDEAGEALGIFGEFDVLPKDGIPRKD